eukprot:2579932-Rhodomonas_salina.1
MLCQYRAYAAADALSVPAVSVPDWAYPWGRQVGEVTGGGSAECRGQLSVTAFHVSAWHSELQNASPGRTHRPVSATNGA